MKVLLFNGSYNPNGCTFTALSEVSKALNEEGIETEILNIGGKPIRDCIACGGCAKTGLCVFNDDVANEWIAKAKEADGFIFGSPVYYAHPSGRILSVLDRMFYAGKKAFEHKPGASIVVARRGGTASSYDVLNKYMGIAQMPIISSTYWNMAYGKTPEQLYEDKEGVQTMKNLGKNMAWILKCIELGKQNNIQAPQNDVVYTNFIR